MTVNNETGKRSHLNERDERDAKDILFKRIHTQFDKRKLVTLRIKADGHRGKVRLVNDDDLRIDQAFGVALFYFKEYYEWTWVNPPRSKKKNLMEEIRKNLIIGLVCDYYGICIEDIKTLSRGYRNYTDQQSICLYARHILCWMLYYKTCFKEREIAELLGIERAAVNRLKKCASLGTYPNMEEDLNCLNALYEKIVPDVLKDYFKSFD